MVWRVEPLHVADVTFPGWHPRAGENGPAFAFLPLGDSGPLLVDTGLGPPHAGIDEWYRPRRYSSEVALLGHGLRLGDIRAVVLSHLHFDHVGNAHLFAGVPLYVQRAERDAARESRYTIAEFVDFEGARYELLDGDYELRPGVRVLATPGHTPGHQSVAVETNEASSSSRRRPPKQCPHSPRSSRDIAATTRSRRSRSTGCWRFSRYVCS